MATLELEDGSTIKIRKSLKVEPDGGVIVDGKYYPPVEEPKPDVTITFTAHEMIYGKATKKPVEINWYRWDENLSSLINWVATFDGVFSECFDYSNDFLKVNTMEGHSYNVPNGYIIIRGVDGEFYPCDYEIFKKTYDIVD